MDFCERRCFLPWNTEARHGVKIRGIQRYGCLRPDGFDLDKNNRNTDLLDALR